MAPDRDFGAFQMREGANARAGMHHHAGREHHIGLDLAIGFEHRIVGQENGFRRRHADRTGQGLARRRTCIAASAAASSARSNLKPRRQWRNLPSRTKSIL